MHFLENIYRTNKIDCLSSKCLQLWQEDWQRGDNQNEDRASTLCVMW